MSRLRKSNFIVIPLALFTFCFFGVSCDPFHVKIDDTKHEITHYTSGLLSTDNAVLNDELLVMNWNIRFGGGRIPFYWDCYGDRTLMVEDEVYLHLEAIAAKINDVNPDVLMIQEIDINSKRSVYVDQVQWILDNTSFNYAVYAPNWKADFVPSDGHGRMNTGVAIFSKWTLENARRVALPLIEEQAATTRYFYLRRNFLECTISPDGGSPIAFLNIHASAWAQDDTKQKQMEVFKAAMDSVDASGSIFCAGGDFNIVPPGSEVLTDFEDALDCDSDFPPDDFTDQVQWMEPFYTSFEAAIPLDSYLLDNSKYYSYTADENGFWTRKLDHLFTNGSFVEGSGSVHQNSANGGMETMSLSDHAPMVVKIKLK